MESGGTTEPIPLPVDGEEYRRINRRRGDLIHKKYDVGLCDKETAELAWLEEVVDVSVEHAFPRTPPDWELLRRLEERAAAKEGNSPNA
jgi:hypothetical protein